MVWSPLWTQDRVTELHALWNLVPQISTLEISRRLGITKNATIAKADRMRRIDPAGWPARPSPISAKGSGKMPRKTLEQLREERRPCTRAPTLPGLASLKVVLANLAVDPVPLAPSAMPVMPTAPAEPVKPAVTVRVTSYERLCCFPIGTPRKPGFRYCDMPVDPAAPRRVDYCPEHQARCYVPVRRRAEDAYGDVAD